MSTNSGGNPAPPPAPAAPTAQAGELAVPQAVADLQEYLCIEYPGIVKNVDKALETLGGFEKIQAVRPQKMRSLLSMCWPLDLHADLTRLCIILGQC